VALDVDGTLAVSGNRVTDRVAAAVRRAVASGAHVVLSTGRSVPGTLPLLAGLGLPVTTMVCSNGAVLVENRPDGAPAGPRTSVLATFDAGPAVRMLRAILPDAVFAAEHVDRLGLGHRITGSFTAQELVGEHVLVDDERLADGPVTRLVTKWPAGTTHELGALLAGLTLPGVTSTRSHNTAWITAVAEGTSKATALELVRTRLGIAAHDTLAAGDGTNDVEMMRWAAHGVAMGQGAPAVLAAADEVTGSVLEDGLAAALDRWFGTV
jgi:hydroxymethylpyrimidine pyrophosphatase-like HAD family hydrolase